MTVGEISSEELASMLKRCGLASPAPWKSLVADRDNNVALNCIQTPEQLIGVLGGTPAEQDFIAHARNDVPRLIKEIQMLRVRLERIRRRTNE